MTTQIVNEIKEDDIRIRKVVTSQSETVQAKQYEPNQYFTSMELDFGDGISLTDAKGVRAIMKAVELANILCTNNNRKNEWRDGIAPRIGISAEQYTVANPNDKVFVLDNVIKPAEMNNKISKTISDLQKLLGMQGLEPKMTSSINPVTVVPATVADPDGAPEVTTRVNPKRKAKTTEEPNTEVK